MQHNFQSIRPFIGAKDFELSRQFYRDLGFAETVLMHNMCLFQSGSLGFYLQDAHVEEWINNTMVFMEVQDVTTFYEELLSLGLSEKYPGVRLVPIREFSWGSECYLHDPSGILWHFGTFKK